ncbi:hypothetical protein KAK06_06200 [Ideonella sp. 4Y11]|uniref:Methyl-accepting chemotaxis protein n=1 Tax=Ideonella aquatica TaxID=2824119 RepID=A0A940YGZ3_9BURK|nr:methyl-accepting chemotaxis protein [Ideonella aquatica]MBQ0958547.1 hypothetical protein [Ideonella aquatica]
MNSSVQSPTGLADFFKYHGVWAPGVRLFRRLGFRAKALVISSAFVVPIIVLAYNYFGDKAASIAFSAKEQIGLEYARSTLALVDALQQRQTGEAQATDDSDRALSALQAKERDHSAALGTGAAFDSLASAVRSIRPGDPTAVEGAVSAAIALIGQATDGSNLTLDPDIDTYYLMNVSMFRAAPMSDSIVQLMAVLARPMPPDGRSPAEQRLLIERLADLRSQAAGVRADLAKARAYNPQLSLGDDGAGLLASVEQIARIVDGQIGPQASASGAGDFRAAAGAALSASRELRQRAVDELGRLLAVRVLASERARNATAALMGVSLLMVVYLFTAFRKVLDGGLREVAFHINAMRDGDLTTRPNPWGADEAAQLMNTLLQMQSSLREIVSQVRSAADSIVEASAEISSGSQDLSARTERSAASLQESASAMEQIAATVQHTALTAREASALAERNAHSAQKGYQVVGSMIDTMDQIQQSSARISDIIGSIDGIAFQTSILALNAAVEANRAGEAGRGFAVVATEVRRLAQRAAEAAREVKLLVIDSSEQVSKGSEKVTQSGQAIEQIMQESRRINELLGQIARGAGEQASGVRQTTTAVQDMDSATQQNAALVEQTAAAASSLADQARRMAQRVQQFKLA